jgi:hypothetical protein
MAQNKR